MEILEVITQKSRVITQKTAVITPKIRVIMDDANIVGLIFGEICLRDRSCPERHLFREKTANRTG